MALIGGRETTDNSGQAKPTLLKSCTPLPTTYTDSLGNPLVLLDNINIEFSRRHGLGPLGRSFRKSLPPHLRGLFRGARLRVFPTWSTEGTARIQSSSDKAFSTTGDRLLCYALGTPLGNNNIVPKELIGRLKASSIPVYQRQLRVYEEVIQALSLWLNKLLGNPSGFSSQNRFETFTCYQCEFYVQFSLPPLESQFFEQTLEAINRAIGVSPDLKRHRFARWEIETPKTRGNKNRRERTYLKFYEKDYTYRLEVRYEKPKIGRYGRLKDFICALEERGQEADKFLKTVLSFLDVPRARLDVEALRRRIKVLLPRVRREDERVSELVRQLGEHGVYRPTEIKDPEARLSHFQLSRLCSGQSPVLRKQKLLNTKAKCSRRNAYVLALPSNRPTADNSKAHVSKRGLEPLFFPSDKWRDCAPRGFRPCGYARVLVQTQKALPGSQSARGPPGVSLSRTSCVA